MAKIRFEYDIEKCLGCPKCKSNRTTTPDSWEVAFDYFCEENGRNIANYVEHDWEMPEVPDWCPFLVKE